MSTLKMYFLQDKALESTRCFGKVGITRFAAALGLAFSIALFHCGSIRHSSPVSQSSSLNFLLIYEVSVDLKFFLP